jgi:hypothetical protein
VFYSKGLSHFPFYLLRCVPTSPDSYRDVSKEQSLVIWGCYTTKTFTNRDKYQIHKLYLMVKKIITTLLSIIIVNVCYSQTLTKKSAIIRAEVQKINNGSGYKIKTLSNEEFLEEMTDGGGELQAFYRNGELVKIVEKIYLSSCIRLTEYYLKKSELIFAYTQGKEWYYNEQLNKFDSKIITLKMKCRFYYENSKLINSIFKGQTRCSGEPSVDWAKNYIDNLRLYQKKLGNK